MTGSLGSSRTHARQIGNGAATSPDSPTAEMSSTLTWSHTRGETNARRGSRLCIAETASPILIEDLPGGRISDLHHARSHASSIKRLVDIFGC